MTIMIQKLTSKTIKTERAKLLRKARVSTVLELQKRRESWDLTIEEYGILTRLESLAFLEGSERRVK